MSETIIDYKTFLKNNKGLIVTYEKLVDSFTKTPTKTETKEILKLVKEYKIDLKTSAELAKLKNIEDAIISKKEQQKRKQEQLNAEEILKDKELLEWSRSDSPVRMYLREMGIFHFLQKRRR